MTQPVFAKVPTDITFPALEERILALWDTLDAFAESNRRRAGGPEFTFYDGPPFATGTPHYGHLLAGTIKDIVPRFWNMRGHHVERRFGWDCHGLPIESLAQKELGWSGAGEITQKGVGIFNEQCRSMVQTYVGEWRRTVRRMGRWVDFDNDYKTMDVPFMESVWWVFSRLWEQGRVYKAHRIMPYSPKLTTPLSNFEAGNNYQDVQDPAITVRFRVRAVARSSGRPVVYDRCEEQSPDVDAAIAAGRAFILAWTTTPWTLPENLALCAGPAITYQWIEDVATGDVYLVAKDRVASLYKKPEQYRVLAEPLGDLLAGLEYEPLFPYFADTPHAFRLLTDGFVSTGDGTGIVHIAPAYGEDDYRVGKAAGIAPVDPLDAECRFTARVPEYAGQFCKDADKAIIARLKDEKKLVHQATIVHAYPFCERTGAPLIYRAIEAWYVRVEDLRDKLAANNAQIRWVPEQIGSNRFGNWLKEAKDWNISRNRFWGSCIPVWVNVEDKNDQICVGSVADLERLSGQKVTDLHKHHLDAITIVRDGKTYKRTPEVLDCWFESGAMPYGQQHYPFENKARFEANFPAQFIAEGLDQTRGWFYTLLVLSTALFERPAFQNVVVNGLVLAEDGQKMSKSKKNYPDPTLVLDQYGADALRAYLIDSPVVRAEPLRFSEAGLKDVVRTVVLPTWNALSFFTTYASVDGFDPRTWTARPVAQRHVMDRWILSVLQSLVRDVNTEMEAYRLSNVVPRLDRFIDDLTNSYIRTCRSRFWKSDDRADQTDAYHTLYQVLTTFARVLAPFMPFLTEELHQRLVRVVDPAAPASIHWCDYPQPDQTLIDATLESTVATALTIGRLGRTLREQVKLKIRQPLSAITVVSRDPQVREAAVTLQTAIAQELNVKAVRVSADEAAVVSVMVKPNFKTLRARCGAKLKDIGTALASWGHAEVAALESGGSVPVCGEALSLDDVLLERKPVAGAVVASEGPVTVVLDQTLTPALVAEGHAREFISLVQQGRKDAGFAVSDRITVTWQTADAGLAEALSTWQRTIGEEVLATALHRTDGGPEQDLNGLRIAFTLSRA